MKKRMFYYKADAEKAAASFVEDNEGTVIREKLGEISSSEETDDDDIFAEKVGSWGGTTSAIVVEDGARDTVAKFGFWTEEDD